MFISAAYIRFFRSFNFDYLRKAHREFEPHPWDVLEPDGLQYPFVKVSLERDVSTVVGANESGKSQLLTAIKHGLTGKGIERGDFCRYSQFFAVKKAMAFPDFGLEFKHLGPTDLETLAKACKTKLDDGTETFWMFRIGGKDPVVYVRQGDDWAKYPVKDKKLLDALLPQPFEIDATVALPQSVPIKYLADAERSLRTSPRKTRLDFVNQILENGPSWFGSAEGVSAATPTLISAFSTANTQDAEHDKQLALADDLLLKVAGIDRTAFQELLNAVEEGKDGFANGIVERINRGLSGALNFPKWWSQDLHFQLLVTLRDQDLVFTIRDRTGTEYSADERSGGLKYFLSYFVQYLSHEPPKSGAREVLLMDEPDAYLSSTGQQDLLRIFEDFAHPQDPTRTACQVVYVTHSPFLIDKNHGDRIRVLEKGEGDEGTRVVRNAARNHYEPLRSAFGGFVAETTFISNCNLMLEGMSDQVMLAGMSARLRRQRTASTDSLDLNAVTLVPAGSAPHIPYLVYLARGRDVDRPAVIVLLDSDASGDQAVKALKKGPNGKPVIDARYVLQLGDLPTDALVSTLPAGVVAIEDLIPLPICIEAVKRYANEFLDPTEAAKIGTLKPKDVNFEGCSGTHDALEQAATAKLPGFHLDKVGFARSVLQAVREDSTLTAAAEVLDANFRVLFRELGRRQRQAMREITTEKTSAKIKRIKRSFLLDHPTTADRAQATLLLEEAEAALDNSVDAEELKSHIRTMRRDFELDEDPTEPINDFGAFRDALEALVYREVNEVQEP
ncbi:AAA family ATPase [Micromonospora sp. WMMD1155]|uniref:AAA family ATPase n=1 Tax=Micromonospora sp. WMMD1155 TaxID=3016094 RepID=UPI00249CBA1A|nr:AAA family ATPase [Micromonospora sp. WMMD1155]WFE53121.1 AAA family ATPase [Micromonospora sp. WMMD1155]